MVDFDWLRKVLCLGMPWILTFSGTVLVFFVELTETPFLLMPGGQLKNEKIDSCVILKKLNMAIIVEFHIFYHFF